MKYIITKSNFKKWVHIFCSHIKFRDVQWEARYFVKNGIVKNLVTKKKVKIVYIGIELKNGKKLLGDYLVINSDENFENFTKGIAVINIHAEDNILCQ